MHRDVVILDERGDAIPGNRRQKLVKGFPICRKRLVLANEILILRDDLHRPVFLAADLAEDIDKHGDIVLGEFAGEFGMFELGGFGRIWSWGRFRGYWCGWLARCSKLMMIGVFAVDGKATSKLAFSGGGRRCRCRASEILLYFPRRVRARTNAACDPVERDLIHCCLWNEYTLLNAVIERVRGFEPCPAVHHPREVSKPIVIVLIQCAGAVAQIVRPASYGHDQLEPILAGISAHNMKVLDRGIVART